MTYNIFLDSGTAQWEISVHSCANDTLASRFFDAGTITKRTMVSQYYYFPILFPGFVSKLAKLGRLAVKSRNLEQDDVK